MPKRARNPDTLRTDLDQSLSKDTFAEITKVPTSGATALRACARPTDYNTVSKALRERLDGFTVTPVHLPHLSIDTVLNAIKSESDAAILLDALGLSHAALHPTRTDHTRTDPTRTGKQLNATMYGSLAGQKARLEFRSTQCARYTYDTHGHAVIAVNEDTRTAFVRVGIFDTHDARVMLGAESAAAAQHGAQAAPPAVKQPPTEVFILFNGSASIRMDLVEEPHTSSKQTVWTDILGMTTGKRTWGTALSAKLEDLCCKERYAKPDTAFNTNHMARCLKDMAILMSIAAALRHKIIEIVESIRTNHDTTPYVHEFPLTAIKSASSAELKKSLAKVKKLNADNRPDPFAEIAALVCIANRVYRQLHHTEDAGAIRTALDKIYTDPDVLKDKFWFGYRCVMRLFGNPPWQTGHVSYAGPDAQRHGQSCHGERRCYNVLLSVTTTVGTGVKSTDMCKVRLTIDRPHAKLGGVTLQVREVGPAAGGTR